MDIHFHPEQPKAPQPPNMTIPEKYGDRNPNHLINGKYPCLLQFAYNPVNWYPWSDEAFEIAKIHDKSIFLSVGYTSANDTYICQL